MSDPISISKTLSIRDCGLDEYWLQYQICVNPSILGLGELDVVTRERQQSSGGKLDLLLGNSENATMYEVEVMLGATDESHIIRTIEYWELERRRWPKRVHTAILVAETINRRFFNVIQLLSLTIPIIAIQANIIEADGKRILHFTKILNAYQETELEERQESDAVDENYWQAKAAWTLGNAKTLQQTLARGVGELELSLKNSRIGLLHNGEIFFSLRKRSNGKSAFLAWLKNSEANKAAKELDEKRIPYDLKPWNSEWQTFRLMIDQNFIQENDDVFQKIAELTSQSWDSDVQEKQNFG